MTHKEVALKLIGNIHPQGEGYADRDSMENLKHLATLIDELLLEMYYVSGNRNRRESSIAEAGGYAMRFLKNISLWLDDVIE